MANTTVAKALENLEPLAKILLDLHESGIGKLESIDIEVKLRCLVFQNLEVINKTIEGMPSTFLFPNPHDLLQQLGQAASIRKTVSSYGWKYDCSELLDPILIKMIAALEASSGETQKDVLARRAPRVRSTVTDYDQNVPASPDLLGSGMCTPEPETEKEIGEPLSQHGHVSNSAYAKAKDVIILVAQLSIVYRVIHPDHRRALATAIENRLSALSKKLELPEHIPDGQLLDLLKEFVALDKELSDSGIRSRMVGEHISRCIIKLGSKGQ
ncbi:MAG: hypothetical protein Q9208_001252 [Pyrenodesmia sp. 3 TL-2023]